VASRAGGRRTAPRSWRAPAPPSKAPPSSARDTRRAVCPRAAAASGSLGGQLVRLGEQAGGHVGVCDACVSVCGAHGAQRACVRAGTRRA
jgi:hypothetical protein